MASLRDARADVIRRHYRGMVDDLFRELPRLLDDLEAADLEQAGPRASEAGPKVAITLNDGTVVSPSTPVPPPKPTTARPAPRRRTRT